MIIKLMNSQTQKIGVEQRETLSFYKNLFNYKYLYVFPPIKKSTLHPLLSIGRDKDLAFYKARDIDWLNFYHKTYTKDNLGENSAIERFFKHYEIDFLYPIHFNDECFGFLAINAHGKNINDLEGHIAKLIIDYLSSIWHNQNLVKNIEDSSKQTERLLQEVSTLLEVSQAIETGGRIQGLLELIMEKCMAVMKIEAASLLLITADKKHLEFRVALGPKSKDIKQYFVQVGKGIAGAVAKTGEAMLIPDAYQDKRFDQRFDAKSGFKTKSILCVPLLYRKKIMGVVQALNRFDGQPFNEHDLRTFKIFATQAALAIQNTILLHKEIQQEKLQSQIIVASEIQRLIVPEILPAVKDFEMSACYIPSQGIGGDFYSVIPISQEETVFCMADVSGKSIPGALLVSTLHASLKAYLEFTNDIKKVMQKLNELIINLSTSSKFITLFIARYDTVKNKIYYISAGHNLQYVVRGEEWIKMGPSGVAIGIIPFDYKIKKVELQKNDLILLFTDGIIEARDKNNKVFGEERLMEIVNKNRNLSCDALQKEILKSIKAFAENPEKQDDLTLLVMRRK
jgi:phosphoserine phosphatase RsbU/P